MSRPPSQAVIEAVEQAEREHRWFEWCGNHPDGEFCCECGTHDTSPHHRRFEVARAAEAAALKVAAAALDEHDAEVRPTFAAADRLLASPAVHPYTVLEAEKWLRARADRIEAGRDED